MESHFSVALKPSVEKDLRSIPVANVARVMKVIEALAEERFLRQSVRLSGAERLYRIRLADYRIVYEVDSQARQITIHYVRHRREVYRAL